MIEPKVVFVEGKECHVIGDWVMVAWTTREEEKTVDIGGHPYIGLFQVRSGEPFILFGHIRYYGEPPTHEAVIDEENYITDQISLEDGMRILAELWAATTYLAKQLGKSAPSIADISTVDAPEVK